MEFDKTHMRATPAADPLEDTSRRAPQTAGIVIDGRYRLGVRLATGGMGEVYRAEHVELGRAFALKLMRPELSDDPGFVERFRREAITASRLGHPNIVDIVDSGRSETGQFYFVMEFLDGQTLTRMLDDGPLPLPLALDLLTQLGRALEVAHKAGVVHRDLKPDNVIVIDRGHGPVVKVVDFGIARVVAPAPDIKQTTHGVIMGTPQYMAPEQAAGLPVDHRADLYAFGLLLYELLTGKPPFTGDTAALVMSAHIATPAPKLPATFPAPLRTLLARLLAKRPDDRPASMSEVLAQLALVPRVEPRKGAPRTALAVAAVVVVSALVGGLVVLAVARTPEGEWPSRTGAAAPTTAAVTDAGALPAAVIGAAPAAETGPASPAPGDLLPDAGSLALPAQPVVVPAPRSPPAPAATAVDAGAVPLLRVGPRPHVRSPTKDFPPPPPLKRFSD